MNMNSVVALNTPSKLLVKSSVFQEIETLVFSKNIQTDLWVLNSVVKDLGLNLIKTTGGIALDL